MKEQAGAERKQGHMRRPMFKSRCGDEGVKGG